MLHADLRECSTLSPNGAVMADDGGGGEMVACAIDVTHQVFIYVGLPRHYLCV